jgi:hypothetical protein
MNRAEIRTKVKALLNRNDCTDEQANIFIDQAQTRIERTLRVPGMEKISITTGNALTPTDQIVIPSDFLSVKEIYSDARVLKYKDLSHFLRLSKDAGSPEYYTRVAGSYLLRPIVPEGVSLYTLYYAAQPSLSTDTAENLFTNVCSDALIFGALVFAAYHFVDDRAMDFEQALQTLLGELNEQARMTDMEQSSMAIEPAYGNY